MKINKTLKVGILSSLVSIVATGGIAVAAVSLSAKEIPFTSNDENWQVNNVEDAVNDLYELNNVSNKLSYIETFTLSSDVVITTNPTEYVISCTSISGYEDLTADSFIFDISKHSFTTSNNSTVIINKKYDSVTGNLTISFSLSNGSIRGNSISFDIYVL